jgi:hypothetical protein
VRNRSAVGILLSIVLIFVVIPAAGAAKGRLQIYVDANTGVDTATGTINDPFATIGAAVAAVRSVRGGVDINVRAGTYRDESFPILIDANDRVIRGTRSDGGQANSLIVARPVLPMGQAMIAVIADNVTLHDLDLDGGGAFGAEVHALPDRNYGVYIDTAQGFTVGGVTARGTTVGVYARRSSGDIVDGTFKQNNVGIFVAAGDPEHQAAVRVLQNVITLNCVGGAFFTSTSEADVPVPTGVPLTTEALEGSLDVELAHNRITRNTNGCGAAGTQFFPTSVATAACRARSTLQSTITSSPTTALMTLPSTVTAMALRTRHLRASLARLRTMSTLQMPANGSLASTSESATRLR